jgi:hypothetical protein
MGGWPVRLLSWGMPVLSRTQSNDIYALIEKAGLSPGDFDRTSEEVRFVGLIDTFAHRPTGGNLKVSMDRSLFKLTVWPQFSPEGNTVESLWWGEALLGVVEAWLRVVKAEHDVPDLWAEARKERQLSDAANVKGADNRPFTAEELRALEPQLREVEAFIVSREGLDTEQQARLRTRFQYLLDAAKRGVGKIDWVNIFVGQIFGMVTEGLLHTSSYGPVMHHAWTVLRGIVTKLLG